MTDPLSKLRTFSEPTNGLAWVREAKEKLEELETLRTNLDLCISAIERLGHSNHCAHRLAFGDGECVCHPESRPVDAAGGEDAAPPRAKPDCSECRGTGNAIVGNELTSNVVPCHCVAASAIAGLYVSPFGTPLGLIPRDGVEFVSDGFRALRFVDADGESCWVRVKSSEAYEVNCTEGKSPWEDGYELYEMEEDDFSAPSYSWLRHWLPRADEPIERAAEQPSPVDKDSLTAEADDALAHERWFKQTRFFGHELGDDCMETALACLLGVPRESVPDFPKGEASAQAFAFEDFVNSLGFELMRCDAKPAAIASRMFDRYYLATGPTERHNGEVSHMVVMRNGELAWDPHPEGDGLAEVHHTYMLIPLDPAAITSERARNAEELERERAKVRELENEEKRLQSIIIDNAHDVRGAAGLEDEPVNFDKHLEHLQSEVTRLTAALGEARRDMSELLDDLGELGQRFEKGDPGFYDGVFELLCDGSLPVALPESGEGL